MKQYRVVTKFEIRYPHEIINKTEETDDFSAALNTYIIRIQDPETIYCCLHTVNKSGMIDKIIAAFNTKQAQAYFFKRMLIRLSGYSNLPIINLTFALKSGIIDYGGL